MAHAADATPADADDAAPCGGACAEQQSAQSDAAIVHAAFVLREKAMGLLSRVARGAGDAVGGAYNRAKWNAGWYGAGSNAVLGAILGGTAAGIGGGDIGDIGRGALYGGAGGALGATAGVPFLSSMAGPIAGVASGVSQIAGDPAAQRRRARGEAQVILRQAAAIDPQLTPKAIQMAFEQHNVHPNDRELVAQAIADEMGGGR